MRFLVRALLLLVLLLALLLRENLRDGHRLPPAERGGPAPTWVVDDPDAAYHLRRVELALAEGRVPTFDRFLNHPDGSPIPWPPFLDGALARLAAALGCGPDEGGAIDEARLEAILVHVPPVLGTLATLAVFVATATLLAGRSALAREGFALVAAVVYAGAPAAAWYGGVTRIDHHVLVGLAIAAHLALVTRLLRAESLAPALALAVVAGAVAAATLLSWLAAGVVVAAAGSALALRATLADDPGGRVAERAGLLYFCAAAICVLPSAEASPWNELRPGSLLELTSGVPRALLAACAPFAASALTRVRGGGPGARLALAAAATLAVTLLLPGFRAGVAAGIAWASRDHLFMSVVAESRPLLADGPWYAALARELSLAVLLFPLACIGLLARARRFDVLHLLLVAGVLLAMALGQRRFANSFAVPLAVATGAGLALLGALARRPRWLAPALGLAAVLGAGHAAAGLLSTDRAELERVRAWRAEVVGGLRWMREGTPAPGPWDSSTAPQSWGVLAHWGLGHLVEYHARRPTIATNFGSFVGEEGFRHAAEALLETDPERFLEAMRERSALYVVATTRESADVSSLLRIAEVPHAERQAYFARGAEGRKRGYSERALSTALVRLATAPPGAMEAPAEHYPGLELVWASPLREALGGGPPRPGTLSGPVISIYRVATLERPSVQRSK